jgi:NAD(P)-dependent dehydrogenase (short-subunit alcohol dehydrogenase family)
MSVAARPELAPAVLAQRHRPRTFRVENHGDTPLEALDDRLSDASPVPVGRIGAPPDVAAAVIYLSSRAANYVTGAVIPVDGGLSRTLGFQI